MTDSFADLWASSAPTKPTPQQTNHLPRKQQYDAFSILSASQPPSKPVTNTQLGDRHTKQAAQTLRSEDAFSSLFTSSLGATVVGQNPDQANLTMAERAVLTQKAKLAQSKAASARNDAGPASSSLWDGLDALARPSMSGSHSQAVPSTTSPLANVAIENDDWGLSGLSSPPYSEVRSPSASIKPISGSTSALSWDLDEFGSSQPQASELEPDEPSRTLTGTPGDFNFGDREDSPLGDDSDREDTFGIRSRYSERPEDDILGDLSKPVSQSHTPSPNPSTSTTSAARPSRVNASPPPHITGQLVEMGFSPIDARAALANTMSENGFDVQAAAEQLLSQASQEESIGPSAHLSERERRRNGDRNRDSDHSNRPSLPTRPPLTQSPHSSQPGSQSQPQLDTAERLLSQASEFGRGMFSKANALWKEGRERAAKMYEERAAVANTSGVPPPDGRPRWMRDRDHVEGDWQQPGHGLGRNTTQTEFKDDEDEGQERDRAERHRLPARRPLPSHTRPPPQSEQVDLFSVDSPTTVYQSPFRRAKSKPEGQAPPSSTVPHLSTRSSPSTSQRSAPPPPTFTTTISLSTFTTSMTHKSAGTDAYKRGDFPVALAAYTRALTALPPEHVLRLPILTNVALVGSRVGELRDAIKACEEAVVIVRRFISGSGEAGETSFTSPVEFDAKTPVEIGTGKVNVSVQGEGGAPSSRHLSTVDLVEGLSKAFKRRAESLEGLEKWALAQSAWEALFGAEWASPAVKAEAMKGVGRCRAMVDSNDAGSAPLSSHPLPKPKPKSKPIAAASPPSAAVTALRSTQDAQQTEDAARLACKDTVDTRLTAWKSGREGNIRTLLTSLDDTVLWPDLGWRKIGLSEVVSKGQVKGAYMRAIAKVHPDKLHAGNTTVEQRVIANGVFGTLNDAWNVFQQQQP